MKSIHELLEIALKHRASDLVIKAGSPPAIRVDGIMQTTDLHSLTPEDTCELAYGIICSATRDYLLQAPERYADQFDLATDDADCRMKELRDKHEMDLVFTIPNVVRVRANLFLERGSIGAVLRIIPLHPYTIDELFLPSILKEMALMPQGLVLITGPTGSGKTTALAAFIEEINRNRPCNVFTIEDPIEYVFTDKKSIIHQREVGRDTQSF